MSDAGRDKDKDSDGERKRDKFNGFLQKNITKGELALKHAVGLGHQPNVVPLAKPKFKDRPRPVEVGWHPVGGAAGKWFAEGTGLGKIITERIRSYPDPTQHWAVLVGDFAHQLWMDENFDVIYVNERINREDWRTFDVGTTRFNDDAIRRTGESVIENIRKERPAYNLITNNCQTYALQLIDAIKAGEGQDFGTTLAIYKRLVGPGKVADLFAEHQADEPEMPADASQMAHPPGQQDTVKLAQQVMDENTAQLDTQSELDKVNGVKKDKKKKKGILSMFSRKDKGDE
jgi:hypothetical protein